MPAKRRTDPSQAMAEAEAALTRAGAKFKRHSDFHLKVQAFNFWPSTGNVRHDDDRKPAQPLGLAVFIRLLNEAGLATAQPLNSVDDPAAFIVQRRRKNPASRPIEARKSESRLKPRSVSNRMYARQPSQAPSSCGMRSRR